MLRIFRVTRNSSYYMSSGFSSLIFMMAIFVVFAHFISCGWFAIGECSMLNYVLNLKTIISVAASWVAKLPQALGDIRLTVEINVATTQKILQVFGL